MKYVIIIITAIALAGCSTEQSTSTALDKWVGAEVTVQFRRDLLGTAGNPIAPTSTWLNNTKVSLNGKISEVSKEGLFLDARYKMNSGDAQFRESLIWIPADSILMIEKRK